MRKMMLSGLLVGLAAATTMSAPAAADPPQRCYGIAGGGTTTLGVAGFSGTVEMRVGGDIQQVGVVTALTPTGTAHTFTFEQGDIVTHDVFLAPVGPQLWSAMRVVEGGTGALRLLPTGTIDFGAQPPTATWDIRGRVCFD